MDCPYTAYYLNQSGAGIDVFRGTPGYQKGYGGLGSLFSSIFKAATPLFKRGARYLSKQAVNTGMAIARDVADGGDWRSSTHHHLNKAGQVIAGDAANYLEKLQSGSGPRIKRHYKKRKTNKKKKPVKRLKKSVKRKSKSKPNRKVPKRQRMLPESDVWSHV